MVADSIRTDSFPYTVRISPSRIYSPSDVLQRTGVFLCASRCASIDSDRDIRDAVSFEQSDRLHSGTGAVNRG